MVSKKPKTANTTLLLEAKEKIKETKKKESLLIDKDIISEGQPRGANPIIITTKAKTTFFSQKLADCKTSFQALDKPEQKIIEAENLYIDKYRELGSKIIEAKAVYQAENNKKLSDQTFTDLFNEAYSSKNLKISRATVQRAKKLYELWDDLDRTQKICLIRGENWIDSIKYARNKLQEKTSPHEQIPASESTSYKPDLLVKGIDAFEVFSKAIDELQKEKASLSDIVDTFLSCLTSDEAKYSLKEVEEEFKKAYSRLSD